MVSRIEMPGCRFIEVRVRPWITISDFNRFINFAIRYIAIPAQDLDKETAVYIFVAQISVVVQHMLTQSGSQFP